ncbi:hypothetical protein ACOSQ2_011111 [Xanthoceras sorbifolium]
MEEACKEGRSWEEEIYWSHFQCKHFIQYLHSGFDQHLAIPEKVARNLKKKLGETVTLKGPSGNTWSVGITAHNDSLFFNHGWPEFVKDHFLEESDILIFKYNGVSHFDVLMFDGGSQCEKESSYFVRKFGRTDHGSGSQTKRKIGESSVEVIHTSSDCDIEGTPSEKTANNDTDKIPGKPVVSLASTKRFQTGDSFARAVHSRQTVRRKALFTSPDEVEEKPDIEHLTLNGNGALSPHNASNGRFVTEDQRRNAMMLAQAALTTESFLVVMRPTHVYKKFYMSIPTAWITKYLMGESQDLILRCNEKTWNTKFLFWKPRSCGGISGGWKNFALDNNLDEFDVCVFIPERLEVKPIVLNVSIFKVVNEVAPLTQVALSP